MGISKRKLADRFGDNRFFAVDSRESQGKIMTKTKETTSEQVFDLTKGL